MGWIYTGEGEPPTLEDILREIDPEPVLPGPVRVVRISDLGKPDDEGDWMSEPTVTIRCSCGGTFEEPVFGLYTRPIFEFGKNPGGDYHGSCTVPKDISEQVRLALEDNTGGPHASTSAGEGSSSPARPCAAPEAPGTAWDPGEPPEEGNPSVGKGI